MIKIVSQKKQTHAERKSVKRSVSTTYLNHQLRAGPALMPACEFRASLNACFNH